MDRRCALVLPYFGRLPNWFSLFLKSVETNPAFDLLLVTDADVRECSIPKNVHILAETLAGMRSRLQRVLQGEARLNAPYKLCDYKPLYGLLFQEELKGYAFWGHCDADMLWGRLSSYITPAVLSEHDKLLLHGHFTLYRNDPRVNALALEYRRLPCCLDMVMGTDKPCFFDEVGMQLVDHKAGLRVWRRTPFADILPTGYRLHLASICEQKDVPDQRFLWQDGRVLRVRTDGGVDEFMYIHLQKRPMEVHVDPARDTCWEIRPNGFFRPDAPKESTVSHAAHALRQAVGFLCSRLRGLGPEKVTVSLQVKRLKRALVDEDAERLQQCLREG